MRKYLKAIGVIICIAMAFVAFQNNVAKSDVSLQYAHVTASCGDQDLSNLVGTNYFTFMDTTGDLCVSGSGGGGGGGAVTVVNGGDVAQGNTADTAYGGSGSSTVIAALKGIYAKLASTLTVSGTVLSQFSTNNAATTPHVCGSYKFVHITTGTDTQIVAASGSTNIYICDYRFSAAGAQNFFFEKSTSGTCASPTQIDMVWSLAANEAKTDSNPYYRGLNTGAGAQLCVNTSAISAIDIGVFYDQY